MNFVWCWEATGYVSDRGRKLAIFFWILWGEHLPGDSRDKGEISTCYFLLNFVYNVLVVCPVEGLGEVSQYLLFSFEFCPLSLWSGNWLPSDILLAIFFWILWKRHTRILGHRRAREPCYFLLNFVECIEECYFDYLDKLDLLFSFEFCKTDNGDAIVVDVWIPLAIFFWILYICKNLITMRTSPTSILAIFFWILSPEPKNRVAPNGGSYLLFSFEFCVWDVDLEAAEHAVDKLAIFFWILCEGEAVGGGAQGAGDLLFSFEFCTANSADVADVATTHHLLFSFEFCLLMRRFGVASVSAILTCYFLLNFVGFRWNPYDKVWYRACYFLLNFVFLAGLGVAIINYGCACYFLLNFVLGQGEFL